jgi:hypothetical protein
VRKLAREAVIFMLIAAVIGAIGVGIYAWETNQRQINDAVEKASAENAKEQAQSVPLQSESAPKIDWSKYPEAKNIWPGVLLGAGFGFAGGFLVGLIIWTLYRLLRFAVKG